MLDYGDVKRKFAEKLAADPDGVGRFESAFYHTMKWVYEQGVEDGQRATEGMLDQIPPMVHVGINAHRN